MFYKEIGNVRIIRFTRTENGIIEYGYYINNSEIIDLKGNKPEEVYNIESGIDRGTLKVLIEVDQNGIEV